MSILHYSSGNNFQLFPHGIAQDTFVNRHGSHMSLYFWDQRIGRHCKP